MDRWDRAGYRVNFSQIEFAPIGTSYCSRYCYLRKRSSKRTTLAVTIPNLSFPRRTSEMSRDLCFPARHGRKKMRAGYIVITRSDWIFYPWLIARGTHKRFFFFFKKILFFIQLVGSLILLSELYGEYCISDVGCALHDWCHDHLIAFPHNSPDPWLTSFGTVRMCWIELETYEDFPVYKVYPKEKSKT